MYDSDLRMYVLINRPELPLVNAGVQAGHSIAEYMATHGHLPKVQSWVDEHKTMIFLEASENQIKDAIRFSEVKGLTYKTFHEPDLDHLLTAVAFEPITSIEGKELFGKLKLLK